MSDGMLIIKMDKMEKQRDQYKELLIEACKFIKEREGHYPDLPCPYQDFLNKPEIKELMEEKK